MSENKLSFKNHNITINNRNKLNISGVEHVGSYNEDTINLSTIKGDIQIKGEELNISKLNLDDGIVNVSGTINSLAYTGKEGEPKNIWGKIFK